MRAGDLALHGEMTIRALLRRSVAMAILMLLPLALYLATHETMGRSVRALVFGVSWAVSTVSFFATIAAKEIDPRLRVAGRSGAFLTAARSVALLALALGLCALYWAVAVVDHRRIGMGGVALDFAVTATVAVAFGIAVGTITSKEMEGTLVLFFFAGLQAVANPFDAYSRLLPFWSSRELGTYAIDGSPLGSLRDGLVHAAAATTVCVAAAAIAGRRSARR